MWTPRNSRADCSPNTHEMASEMFDLSQPLGPTMAVIPSPWKRRSVRSQNDLKPRIWSFFNLSKMHSLRGEAKPTCQRPSCRRAIRNSKSSRTNTEIPRNNPNFTSVGDSGQDANRNMLGLFCGKSSLLPRHVGGVIENTCEEPPSGGGRMHQ